MNRPGWKLCFWPCKDWANLESIRSALPTLSLHFVTAGLFEQHHGASLAEVAFHKELGQPVPPVSSDLKWLSLPRIHTLMPFTKQIIPKTLVHDAILKGHFEIYGSSNQMSPCEDQFKKYVYPAEGCSPIHMIWTDTPCLMTCWNDSNRIAKPSDIPK